MVQVLDRDVVKDLAKGVEPCLHLCVGALDDFTVVNEDEEVLDLHLLRLDLDLLEALEGHDLLLNVLHAARLLVSTGHLGKLLPIVDLLEILVVESVAIHLELLLNLVGESDEFETELRDDRVDIHVIEESVSDCLL